MSDEVSVRELRNHTAAVLRRVEAGSRLEVTVDRRPVAQLGPLGRRQWVSGAELWEALARSRADPALRDELRAALPQSTDEL